MIENNHKNRLVLAEKVISGMDTETMREILFEEIVNGYEGSNSYFALDWDIYMEDEDED